MKKRAPPGLHHVPHMENGLLASYGCVNHIPVNFHKYPSILPEKEVGRIDCRSFSSCRPSTHRSPSSTYARNKFKLKRKYASLLVLLSSPVPRPLSPEREGLVGVVTQGYETKRRLDTIQISPYATACTQNG